ncbi:hypothetical protein AAG747_12285 [Rapidithrix thailandica]|uniref:DUF4382 domain-containing protein n=1 Tax=Rapidithrix thailandica TaxID=413964 RepID=A0AAW9S6W8_9BACT
MQDLSIRIRIVLYFLVFGVAGACSSSLDELEVKSNVTGKVAFLPGQITEEVPFLIAADTTWDFTQELIAFNKISSKSLDDIKPNRFVLQLSSGQEATFAGLDSVNLRLSNGIDEVSVASLGNISETSKALELRPGIESVKSLILSSDTVYYELFLLMSAQPEDTVMMDVFGEFRVSGSL